MKRLTIYSLLLTIYCSLFANLYAQTAIKHILSNAKLIVGLEAGYKPFEFKEGNKLIGFDIDIAKELARQMNVTVEFKEYKFENLIPALEGEEIDIIISGMTKTLERALKVNFTDPYYKTGQVVVVGSKYKDIRENKELNKKDIKIGFQKKTTGEKIASKTFSSATLLDFDNMDDCEKALLKKEIDAFIFDKPLAEIFVRANRGEAEVLSGELTSEYYCFAVKHGDFDFLNWLNYFISELIKSGKYNNFHQYWFVDEKWKK